MAGKREVAWVESWSASWVSCQVVWVVKTTAGSTRSADEEGSWGASAVPGSPIPIPPMARARAFNGSSGVPNP